MAQAPRIAGTCYCKVDSEQLEVSSDGIEVPMTTINRTPVMSTTGVSGYKEEQRVPYLKAKFNIPAGFPREKLDTMTDGTITAELANGQVYTLSGAFVVGEPSYNSGDGTAEYEFNGVKGLWQ